MVSPGSLLSLRSQVKPPRLIFPLHAMRAWMTPHSRSSPERERWDSTSQDAQSQRPVTAHCDRAAANESPYAADQLSAGRDPL